jgi:DNA-binding PadR family transcriptional regulator
MSGPEIIRREKIRKEMEEISERESSDAAPCLNARKEDAMKLAPFVKFREEKFGAVLFETRSEKVYTLSPTGAAVVRELLAGAGDGDLVSRLKAKYDDKTGRMESEAKAFIKDLKDKGLLTE